MKDEINDFLLILQELQKIDSEFPLQYAVCLAEIFLNEGMSLTALSEKTGMPLSTISRIVGALSKKRQKGTPYGLVKTTISQQEKRRKELYLTTRGHAVMKGIVKAIQKDQRSMIAKAS